jgi:NAD(P)-dependent dehydrogenase (short-subunit alcohol dehydrogenase family)
MAKLIFGCGYLGLRVARRWRDAGEQVYVATRWPARAAALSAEGFSPFSCERCIRGVLTCLRSLARGCAGKLGRDAAVAQYQPSREPSPVCST